jgi:hypothetical protein
MKNRLLTAALVLSAVSASAQAPKKDEGIDPSKPV